MSTTIASRIDLSLACGEPLRVHRFFEAQHPQEDTDVEKGQ